MSIPVDGTTSGANVPGSPEDPFPRRLAEVGLLVPARNPARPHTKTEEKCGKKGAVGVPVGGGRPFHYNPRCKSKGCRRCAQEKADWEMQRIQAWRPDFVGIEQVPGKGPEYPTNADKPPGDRLWVTMVPTPPEDPGAVKERVNKRVGRLVRSGMALECVLVPCDGVTVIISTADLAERKVRGRPPVAPTSGRWLPNDLALEFLKRILTSTAINGRVWWTGGWKPEKPPKRAYAISGDSLITETAWRILWSDDYQFTGSGWDVDPQGVLLEAKERSERFWADPRCTSCDDEVTPKDDHWWREGQALCGVCDLALDLDSILTKGLTEREIEAHLRRRKLTFKRRRDLIEKALARAGAEKMASGIWMRKTAGEEVA